MMASLSEENMQMLLIDGDMPVYEKTSPSTCWKVGMTLFSTKKQALEYNAEHPELRLTTRKLNTRSETVIRHLDLLIAEMQADIREKLEGTFLPADIADSYIVFLTEEEGSTNFRHDIATTRPYKGNRAGVVRPYYYQLAREHLIVKHNAHIIYGEEADDALGIAQCARPLDTVVCSRDKDALTYPGWKYNWRKKELIYVGDWASEYNFYSQILCGDVSDNIMGLYKVGPVTAAKLLGDCKTPQEMLEAVITKYMDSSGMTRSEALDYINEVGALLRIRRYRDEIWNTRQVLKLN